MTRVRVSFTYEPDEPDLHDVGMTEAEFNLLNARLSALGAYDIEIERLP